MNTYFNLFIVYLILNKPTMQLFTETPIDDLLATELFKDSFESGVSYLKNQGMPIRSIISFWAKNDFSIDWKKLWDQYESNGGWKYCTLDYKGVKFIFEDDGCCLSVRCQGVFSLDRDIYHWSEKDIFDSKTANKITNNIKHSLFELVSYVDQKLG